MEFNPVNKQVWNHGIGQPMIMRNKENYEVAQWGHNCHWRHCVEPTDITNMARFIKKYGVDGKFGMRIHAPNTTGSLEHNTVLVKFTVVRKANVSNIPDLNMSKLYKAEVMAQLKVIRDWMVTVQRDIDPKQGWSLERRQKEAKNDTWSSIHSPWTNALLQMTFGEYIGVTCANPACKAPHYDYEETRYGFHVCVHCAQLFKNSNIKYVPTRGLKEDGTVNAHSLDCAPVGNHAPVRFMVNGRGKHRTIAHLDDRSHREKAKAAISTYIGTICDRLRCDTGDGEGFVRKWAERSFDQYQQWLNSNRTRWVPKGQPALPTKLKFGQWHMACVFVWYSILNYERRIQIKTIWSLAEICKAGKELQLASSPNYKTIYTLYKKKRKHTEGKKDRETRGLTLQTVRRYAEEIRHEWNDFERYCGDLKIPSLTSIDCQRNGNLKDAVAVWTACHNKNSAKIPMSGSDSWDTDLVMEDGVLKLRPDRDGNGWKAGLCPGDILREINGKVVGDTVEAAFKQIGEAKNHKKRKMPNGRYVIETVIITIVR